MMDLWLRVKDLQGRTLQTVNGKPFRIASVGGDTVVVIPESTGRARSIPREEIEAAYRLGLSGEELRPRRVRQEGASEFNPAYVVPILKAIMLSSTIAGAKR